MSLSNIVTENTITFTRIKNRKCKSYELNVKEYVNGRYEDYLLATIQNPKTENPIEESLSLSFNEDKSWNLPDDTLGDTAKAISVYVNSSQLSTNNYYYDPTFKALYITSSITTDDDIEVRFKVDRIMYVHKTLNKCEYSVKPIYEYDFVAGQHSML